ncbi:MAG: peptidoglycan-binding domain-containing protein, partial [Pseudomonadota bacterium]
MILKKFIGLGVAAALLAVPAERVSADAKDVIIGGVVGAIIGSAATRQQQQQRQPQRRVSTGCGNTCQQNKRVQAALNHFGYDAGPVDGVPGSRTRAAIRSFEGEMGLFVDGRLDDVERQFLTRSYKRSNNGNCGVHCPALSAGGNRALLRSFNHERLGQPSPYVPNVQAPTYAGVPQHQNAATYGVTNAQPQFGGQQNASTYGVNPPGTVVQPPVQAAPVAAPAAAPANPFAGGFNVAPVESSMQAYCNGTQQLTVANGGYVQVASHANAAQALSEQFCLAREFSTSKGQALVAQIAGMTSADILAQCEQLSTALEPAVAALGTSPRAAVIQQVSQIGAQMPPQVMVQTGQVCLATGYAEDNAKVALAGALMLTTGGQQSYGE